jgi:excisionase family DNA binding protein
MTGEPTRQLAIEEGSVEKLLYKMPEAARVLNLGLTKTYELVNSGKLRSVHVGRSIRIPADALTQLVDELQRLDEPA